MTPYIVTFIVSIFFVYLSSKKYSSNVISILFLSIAIIFPAFLAGYRSMSVATDTQNYLHFFQQAVYYNNFNRYISDHVVVEPGFLFLNYIVAKFGGSYNDLLLVSHFLIVTCIYVALYLHRDRLFPVWGAFIFLFIMYNESLNAMRQYIAISFILLACSLYFKKGSKLKYLFLSILAFLFHYSSIICISYPIIYFWLKKNTLRDNYFKLIIISSIFIGLIILAQFTYVPIITDFFEEKYSHYLSDEASQGVSLTILVVYSYVIYLITTSKLKGRIIDLFIIISAIAVVCCLLGSISVQLYRLGLYFFIFSTISVPYVLKYRRAPLLKTILLVLFLSFWFYSYVYRGSHETIPYHSLILNI